MNKTFKKVLAVISAMAVICCISIPAFAADINTNGGSGTTPVNLSSTVDGTLSGDPAATALSVTVPTALPLAMDLTGNIATADNCKITNNSFGAVRVKSATINGVNGWTLVPFGNKATLANEKVDSNKLGFSITLDGKSTVKTTSASNSQVFFNEAIDGCYMTGAGDTTGNSVSVEYDAIATAVSEAVTGENVADIVFVVEFDTVD